jgi:hypothetical protein
MVEKLFERRRPKASDRVLDAGCGVGEFIHGIVRYCRRESAPMPEVVGIEMDRGRAESARLALASIDRVEIRTEDFLIPRTESFDYVIGNPPYVPITRLNEAEKARYREVFRTATGRFDLYFLFWEQGLRLLKPQGRMVFITPEKYLTVESARPLRRMLADRQVREIELYPESTFAGLVTYPTVTVVDSTTPTEPTRVVRRDGIVKSVRFDAAGDSLAPVLYADFGGVADGLTLDDICSRISAGVATGADRQFLAKTATLSRPLLEYAYPTISGRQLATRDGPLDPVDSLLVPYDEDGRLISLDELNGLGDHLLQRQERLRARTCVQRKPWYAFHETPPLKELLQPKILCRDVTKSPRFWTDDEGSIVPRHSVYYMVPRDARRLDDLAAYLNGPVALDWLLAHCQRAANGYLRLQSSVLKRLPVPSQFDDTDE